MIGDPTIPEYGIIVTTQGSRALKSLQVFNRLDLRVDYDLYFRWYLRSMVIHLKYTLVAALSSEK